ncbi:MAG: response regulator, partial [Nitrospinae bacterium]|nr:response regulator [Nitrospinota bacterium]
HQPDLILLDINLPDMDGFEVFQKLQALADTRNIPVVALSANAMERDIRRALESGFHDYITKPIQISSFLAVIDRFLDQKTNAPY